jgi:DNA-binding Xre family transcriptional regulator
MPEDVRYTELATQAQAGVLECQLAMITFIMMRPYSDFKPTISKELRNEFEVRCVEHEEFRYKENDVLRITVYEYEPGHFMVANNEENLCIYQLYREKRQMSVNCIILGPYTKTWAVLPIDKPFEVTLSEQAGYDPEKTMKQIGKRIYNIMLEKGMHIDEVSRLTGIPYEDLHDMMHDSKSQSLTIEQLERIARVLGIKASDIVPF